jgi:N-acetyl-D-muramate 6-phosphate phosphatase
MLIQSAVFFDLDGTLLDTAPEFTDCMNRLLTEFSLPLITIDSLRASVSQGTSGMLACAFGKKLKDFSVDELKKRFLDFYRERIGSQTDFFTGIPLLLEALQKAEIPWGIVTNKSSQFTLPLIQQFPLLTAARCIVSGDTLKVSKPHPDPLFFAANQVGIAPHFCWYVGDARTDVEASHAAGMKSIVANYGYVPVEEDPITW